MSNSVLSPGLPSLAEHLHSHVPQAGQAQRSKRKFSSSSRVLYLSEGHQHHHLTLQARNLCIIYDSALFLNNYLLPLCHCPALNSSVDLCYPQDDLQSSLSFKNRFPVYFLNLVSHQYFLMFQREFQEKYQLLSHQSIREAVNSARAEILSRL